MIADFLGLFILTAVYAPVVLLLLVIAATLSIVLLLCCFVTWLRRIVLPAEHR